MKIRLITQACRLACLVLSILFSPAYSAQEKTLHQCYIQQDSTGENRLARLYLYADKTYLDFAVYTDTLTKDVFVWFSYGTWSHTGRELLLHSNDESFTDDAAKNFIKKTFARRRDHRMFELYYNYEFEAFKDDALEVSGNTVTDRKHKIVYVAAPGTASTASR